MAISCSVKQNILVTGLKSGVLGSILVNVRRLILVLRDLAALSVSFSNKRKCVRK